jgi:precorrin-6Y C5,15-methyltransferase (decarboxylating)|uniref:Precorrin-6y C5,15-methyltransferase (Decarboxylating) subunit CbiE n=1 Tax=Desulfobacca acetoxidans TaxID=60893 RepID=A0A7C3V6E7_9BACT
MIPVQVVGLGMSRADLSGRALDIIRKAQVLAGGRRHLAYFPEHPGVKIVLGKDPEKAIRQLAEAARNQRVVILTSGDPNFYGLGPLAVRILGPENVVIHPNITAVQAAAARLRITWDTARVISLHGRGWELLDAALSNPGRLFIYTDPEHTPGAIARRLLASGRRTCVRLCILEDLGEESERVTWLGLEEAAHRTFSPLNVVVLEQAADPGPDGRESAAPPTPCLHLGMPEEAYCPAGGLITKSEVRAVALAKLRLFPGQVLWDVGAGCGSVGLEASLLLGRGRVWAVEKNPERAARIAANRDKFRVANLEVICGQAPECLAALPSPHRVFVGGGGDAVGDIVKEVLRSLSPEGIVVLTATRLETLDRARRVLKEANRRVEVVQLQVSRARPLSGGSYLQALNPVWIVTGTMGTG